MAGKPTVRDAQSPGGNRMTEKRMPAAETQRDAARAGLVLHMAVTAEPAGYRAWCLGAKAS